MIMFSGAIDLTRNSNFDLDDLRLRTIREDGCQRTRTRSLRAPFLCFRTQRTMCWEHSLNVGAHSLNHTHGSVLLHQQLMVMAL